MCFVLAQRQVRLNGTGRSKYSHHLEMIELDEVVRLIQDKPKNVELILTGRYADKNLVEMADLVTEMVKIKHPYDEGALARKGIEY
jgi:cob(I)alamin adenosyltransferase